MAHFSLLGLAVFLLCIIFSAQVTSASRPYPTNNTTSTAVSSSDEATSIVYLTITSKLIVTVSQSPSVASISTALSSTDEPTSIVYSTLTSRIIVTVPKSTSTTLSATALPTTAIASTALSSNVTASAPSSVTVSALAANSTIFTSAATNTSSSLCKRSCTQYYPAGSALRWYKATPSTTITAATVRVYIVNGTNYTSTTTVFNDLPSGFTLPATNSAGTQTTVVTGFDSLTTHIAYPTPWADYDSLVSWIGTARASNGTTCSTATALVTATYPPHGSVTDTYNLGDPTGTTNTADPAGVSYVPRLNKYAYRDYNTLLPDAVFNLCEFSITAPEVAVTGAAFLTETTTDYGSSPASTTADNDNGSSPAESTAANNNGSSPKTTAAAGEASQPAQAASSAGQAPSTVGEAVTSVAAGQGAGSGGNAATSAVVVPVATLSSTVITATVVPVTSQPGAENTGNGGASPQATSQAAGQAGQGSGASSSQPAFIISSSTLTPGGTITVGSSTIALQTDGSSTVLIVNDQTSTLVAQTSSAAVLTVGSNTVTANAGTSFVVAGTTLTPGAVLTTAGTTYSVGPSASYVVVNGATSTLSSAVITVAPVATLNNVVTANSGSSFEIAGQTLTPGGTVTAAGSTYVLGPSASYIVINGATSSLGVVTAQAQATVAAITVGNQVYTAIVNGDSTSYVVAGQTLTAGGVITASGTTISLAAGGSSVVVNGITSAVGALTTPAPLTVGNQVYSAIVSGGSTSYVIAGQTLTPGGQIVVSGSTISLAPGATAVVVNGQTSALAAITALITPAPLTVDGQTVSAVVSGGSTYYVINGQTLIPGGVITVDGTTVSLAAGATAVVVDGHTTALTPQITPAPLTIAGETDYATVSGGSTYYVIDGQTLTPGGVITVDGTTISLAPGASSVIVNGKTTTLISATAMSGGKSGSLTKSATPRKTASIVTQTSSGPAAPATTSKKAAASRTESMGWWCIVSLALIGLLFATR